ncbi:hypothetical protein CRG98_047273 [Punica granatum]|uniref:HTH three-helical bundle domain-containing protein n=1 Tax=Punica granatum TaxID=22663 RepID=A0A2I0HM01_PUNGR|nr:hypothetical protein CRG98_047273 [Punica granatum]
MTLTPFPCPRERTAASALLLLSTSSSSSSSTSASLSHSELPAGAGAASAARGNPSSSSSSNLESADSKSCSSSLTSKLSSDEIRAPKLRIVAVASHRHEFKLQVGRRLRLNKTWSYNHQKSKFNEAITKSVEFKPKTISCLSSGSSGRSSATSQKVRKGKAKQAVARGEETVEKPVGSAHIRLRAEAILRFLADGSASEVKIRQVLGDSPDTSKALRM